jgi:hypothetical protein
LSISLLRNSNSIISASGASSLPMILSVLRKL